MYETGEVSSHGSLSHHLRRIARWIVCVAGLFAASACNDKRPSPTISVEPFALPPHDADGTAQAAVNVVGDDSAGDQDPGAMLDSNVNGGGRHVILEHDFGVLRPHSKNPHRFEVVNSDAFTWTVKEVATSCSCTVPAISTTVIRPGKSAFVDVDYLSRGGGVDVNRRIIVRFRESDAPVVMLYLSGVVRAPLTPNADHVRLNCSTDHDATSSFLDVFNYDDSDWSGVGAISSAPWLSVECTALPQVREQTQSRSLRQVFRLLLRASAKSLRPGEHHANLALSASGRDGTLKETVMVTLAVSTPVRPVPSELVFFPKDIGSDRQTRVDLIFADSETVPDGPPDVRVEDTLRHLLSFKWKKSSARIWTLFASLNHPPDGDFLSSRIEILFPATSHGSVELPLRAKCRE